MAVPGRIGWIGSRSATSIPARIDTGEAVHEIDLVMIPEAGLGDYVIAHSGYAIRLVPCEQAEETRKQLGLND